MLGWGGEEIFFGSKMLPFQAFYSIFYESKRLSQEKHFFRQTTKSEKLIDLERPALEDVTAHLLFMSGLVVEHR